MTILDTFRDEARQRGALGPQEVVTLQTAFRVVRDMPYARSTAPDADTVAREWRGTATGKHTLLAALLDALGYDASVMLATQFFSATSTPWLPPHLLEETRERPVPDVHAFLRICHDPVEDEWMTVDATWPLTTRDLGLPVNEMLQPGVDQRIGCDIEELFHVPEDEDPAEVAANILALHAGDEADRRETFLDAIGEWLAANTGGVR